MYLYKETTIEFYKNVAPPTFKPLWDIDFVASSFDEIPADSLLKLSEDEVDAIAWFFEDLSVCPTHAAPDAGRAEVASGQVTPPAQVS